MRASDSPHPAWTGSGDSTRPAGARETARVVARRSRDHADRLEPVPSCVESVAPLAGSRGLAVETRWELAPDSRARRRHDAARRPSRHDTRRARIARCSRSSSAGTRRARRARSGCSSGTDRSSSRRSTSSRRRPCRRLSARPSETPRLPGTPLAGAAARALERAAHHRLVMRVRLGRLRRDGARPLADGSEDPGVRVVRRARCRGSRGSPAGHARSRPA